MNHLAQVIKDLLKEHNYTVENRFNIDGTTHLIARRNGTYRLIGIALQDCTIKLTPRPDNDGLETIIEHSQTTNYTYDLQDPESLTKFAADLP